MILAQTPEATATSVTKASAIGGTARAGGAAPQSFTTRWCSTWPPTVTMSRQEPGAQAGCTRSGAVSGREDLLLAPHFAARHIEQAQGDGSSGGYSEDHGQLRGELRGIGGQGQDPQRRSRGAAERSSGRSRRGRSGAGGSSGAAASTKL